MTPIIIAGVLAAAGGSLFSIAGMWAWWRTGKQLNHLVDDWQQLAQQWQVIAEDWEDIARARDALLNSRLDAFERRAKAQHET